jgi:amino acid permease
LVTTKAGECYVGAFIRDIFPILLAIFALSFTAAVIVAVSRMRKERQKRVIKWLLTIGISGLVIMVVVVVYAFLKGIPT